MATFIFEGAIAVGKSSLIKNVETILKSEFDLEADIYLEPVNQWTRTRGGNILSSLGDSMKKYGFITQAMVMSSLKLQRREISENRKSLNLLERSIWSSKHVFQKTLDELGMLSKLEADVLENLYLSLLEKYDKPTAIIYLKTPADVAWDRCKIRNYASDRTIKRNYFDKIIENYENYINKERDSGTDILTLNTDQSQKSLARQAAKYIKSKFMEYKFNELNLCSCGNCQECEWSLVHEWLE